MEKSWPAVMESIPEMREFVSQNASRIGFAHAKAKRLEIVIEEVTVNIIKYALTGDADARITIGMEESTSKLTIRIADRGSPFDPTDAAKPDLDAPLPERSIGGLGIFLAGKLLDEMSYLREDGWNILTMVKYIDGV